MWTALRAEILRIALPPLAGLGVGMIFAAPGWGLAAGALAALAWSFWNLVGLLRGVGAERGPQGTGVAAEIGRRWRERRRLDSQRRAELLRLRREFITLRRAMPDGALMLDADGAILWANSVARRWFGLEIPGDVGRPLMQIVRDPALIERLEQRRPGEVELASPAQPQTELLVRLAPYDSKRTLLIARDISRLKRLERMRRDFVANVSHELRSPLTVISGYLELMTEDAETPSAWRAPVAEMRRQAVRMVAIVRDLLELARLESEASAPPRTRVDVAALIERVRAQVTAGGVGGRHIDVRLRSRAALLGAETELESAAGNLVSNAVKYTADDGVIEVVWQDAGGGAELIVADNGIGIPERDIPRLTERFYRVDKARSARSGGTGLGLAIVKHVAERHGARLRIESKLGEGSRFVLGFPARRVQRVAEPARTPTTAED